MKIGIAFSTKDRVELSKRSVEPLLQPDKFDLHWVDGSKTEEGKALPEKYGELHIHQNVTGGADAAIVYSLSTLLGNSQNYDYVGLVENDCLLDKDWFEKTMALFKIEELPVGAVSARAYEDRVLFQRDGYAVMHNLGAGMVIFSRRAAEIVLDEFRTGFATENRQVFMQVARADIGAYWAFKYNDQWVCADWNFDKCLARHGWASVALTPAACEMIGQDPPLAAQGLTLVKWGVEARRDDAAFHAYADRLFDLRYEQMACPGWGVAPREISGAQLFFPHQLRFLKHAFQGKWTLKWTQGFGPFSYVAGEGAELLVEISGPMNFLVGNPDRFVFEDLRSGMTIQPKEGVPEGSFTAVGMPASVSHRMLSVKAVRPGGVLYGLQVQQPQVLYDRAFHWQQLPEVG